MSDKYRNPKDMDAKRRRRLVRYKRMAALVSPYVLSDEAFAEVVARHCEFIASGGGGGRWKTFATAGPGIGEVFGVYLDQDKEETEGEQAQLQHARLNGLDLRGVQLPYANLCGVLCQDQDLTGANLSGALLTDADFSGSNFEGADLSGADFSRSDLVCCNLRDANLAGADFENADLMGADLRGAQIEGAKLAQAYTERVLR